MRKVICILLMLGLAGGGFGYWYWRANAPSDIAFRTVKARRGPLVSTISATGTLEPLNVIDVGAQVSGMIEEFGRDPEDKTRVVDYGTEVEEGTVLARLDPSLYQARVDQAKANLENARANLKLTKAALNQAVKDWDRAQNLLPTKGIAIADYDLAEAAYEKAKASVAVAEATIKQVQHALTEAEINLRYCTITFTAKGNAPNSFSIANTFGLLGAPAGQAPLLAAAGLFPGRTANAQAKAKGVIIDRRVNIGQTVVSSLNAPSLFLIATDLSKMQVWASVNEADIGQIKKGQTVRFTVDAFPNKTFEGKVGKVRYNASMTQNVVTYTVEVDVDNAKYDNVLIPYLTTNLQFVIGEKKEVLLVPNTALRWRPQLPQVSPAERDAYAQSLRRKKSAGGADGLPTKPGNDNRERGLVWVTDGDYVRPVKVRIGLSDGTVTEILAGLQDADTVVVGEQRRNGNEGTSNPFAPKLFGGKKQE